MDSADYILSNQLSVLVSNVCISNLDFALKNTCNCFEMECSSFVSGDKTEVSKKIW